MQSGEKSILGNKAQETNLIRARRPRPFRRFTIIDEWVIGVTNIGEQGLDAKPNRAAVMQNICCLSHAVELVELLNRRVQMKNLKREAFLKADEVMLPIKTL